MKIKKSVSVLIILVLMLTNCLFITKSYAIENTQETAYEIMLEEEKNLEFSKETSDKRMWIKFVAPETKYYQVELTNPNIDSDIYMSINMPEGYQNNYVWTKDFGEKFIGYAECTEGETYYINVFIKDEITEDFNIKVSIKEHVHNLVETEREKSTYSENGKKKSDGYIKYTCLLCRYSYTEVIPEIASMTLNKMKYVYDGKTHFPTAIVKDREGNIVDSRHYSYEYDAASGNKRVGRHHVALLFDGSDLYDVAGGVFFKIVPKGTSIKKLTKGRKRITVKWKKQTTQTSGYQIRYSLKKNMSKSKTITVKGNKKTIKTIKKLKAKKKYYVQIRTYKNVANGPKYDKYYSDWSKVKTIKTR